ncbi:MAG TPA: TlpA disulfide reductase family protein [Acidimicrobiales bacterium]|jgi:cytochrome c biogenesis protein CcmG/thiol:disulfide interchange protein DsbE
MSRRATSRARHLVRWVGAAVGVVLVVVAVVLATRPPEQAAQANSRLVGQRAPAISATSFNGSRVTLGQFRGRYVFVNFFASWCGPCQQEAPALVAFAFAQSRLAGGAALVSVDFADTASGARRFLATYGPTWPSLTDPGGTIAYDYGVSSPPTTFLITPSGKVFSELVGPVTAAQLTSQLASARTAGQAR